MIITIDGPSGTGKSTIARLLANRLRVSFFDTGAVYRALAWWIHIREISTDRIVEHLPEFSFFIEDDGQNKQYFVLATNVTEEIRKKEITEKASKIAAIKEVRESLLPIQRDYAEKHDSVFEGRDLGTVVFPKADVKIFLTARADVRAERRFLEMQQKNPNQILKKEEVLEALEERDAQDAGREIAPLKCPEGAFVLDTSDLTISEVVDKLYDYICKVGAGK
jgi:cytidylate kinase